MKRISKKTIILFLLLILAGSFFGYKEYNDPLNRIRRTGIIRIGMTGDYIPMSFLNEGTGTYEGFDVELAEAIADELGVQIEYVPTTWPTLMEDTLKGNFDLAI